MSSNWISASFSSNSSSSHSPSDQASQLPSRPGIATFISLASTLEQDLHDDGPFLFDFDSIPFNYSTRSQVASGASFSVERVQLDQTWLESKDKDDKPLPLWHDPLLPPPKTKAEFAQRTTESRMPWKWWGKYVALKFVKRRGEGDGETERQWTQLILELRTLLHSPIRYHPNIVRFLGLTWDPSLGTSTQSHFPAFILELSELGTLAQFQVNREGEMEMELKMLLGHDVAKGLSILHACGIVHGDLKHENVLVFPHYGRRRRSRTGEEIKFIAKVADFGGSVMDLQPEEDGDTTRKQYRLHTITPPYDAPETRDHALLLSAETVKKTDVYSLGLLVWRVMLDGRNPFDYLGAVTDTQICALKESGEYLGIGYADELDLVDYAFDHTIQAEPVKRDLVQAVAALEVERLSDIQLLLNEVAEKNAERDEQQRNTAPGAHGITSESITLFLARFNKRGGTYDYQEEGPGARPHLSPPPRVDKFVFSPQKLKSILPWSDRFTLFQDLERIAATPSETKTTIYLSSSTASFYLFQCYMHELGTSFNPDHACLCLRQAALSSSPSYETYLAQSWCPRVHLALHASFNFEHPIIAQWLVYSIIRGYRGCIRDLNSITRVSDDTRVKNAFLDGRNIGVKGLNTIGSGLGARWFMPGSLEEEWMYHLDDLDNLPKSIMSHKYPQTQRTHGSKVDSISVNKWGHGLIHLAAAMGEYPALRVLVEVFKADVNLRCRFNDDTPLLCASRGGHTDCVLYLLDKGAEPDGSPYASETPLYWLCAFKPTLEDMLEVGKRLVRAGASLKNSNRPVRIPKRNQRSEADYEDLFLLPVSPLSRAVMMESEDAVTVLLNLGADPLEAYEARSSEQSSICPVVLASVLGYSETLKMLLEHLDETEEGRNKVLFDEAEALYLALDCQVTIHDPTSLESRITRRSIAANSQMRDTLRMLHDRHERFKTSGYVCTEKENYYKQVILALLVALERKEMAEMLLDMGYDPHGIPEACPVVEAVKLNHEPLYRLLLGHGADPKTKIVSEDVEYDLLQILAENKIVYGRPGLFIAEHLIGSGVPVDCPQDPRGISRSAFVSAVINQDFELADCLLRHGANVDFQFAFPEVTISGYKVSVLSYLIHHPTERSLESVRYLLSIPDRIPGTTPPSFIPSQENKSSILHHAALTHTRTDTEKRCLGLMVRAILSYLESTASQSSSSSSSSLIDYHIPNTVEVQPALFLAVVTLNLEVVEELVESGANINVDVGFDGR
ncbi:hypothetical protein VKT23_015932 [Stygiomarasmius scandens]|uniref:Protein kinase domain-containing protein n=1 Tax=Marasmiellus scandens TaxID=2682957 RepID=A0ABR1IXX4_9AGAR